MKGEDSWGPPGLVMTSVDFADCRVVTLSGELDVAVRGAQEMEFDALAAQAPGRLAIIDLSGVTFCDSSGTGVLVRAAKHMDAAGGDLRLVAPPSWVGKALKMADPSADFQVYETWDEPRSALRKRQERR